MTDLTADLHVRLATNEDEIALAQRLRYEVFVTELGGDGPMVDHVARREADRFDPYFEHLLLIDPRRESLGENPVVGVYRLLRQEQARAIGQFYSEDEYDLGPLLASGRKLMELGRSCLHRDYRGGAGVYHLWSGLSELVDRHGIEVLFGTASFHGTDPAPLAEALSFLHQRHLAPPDLRVRSRQFQPMDLLPEDRIDRLTAMRKIPPLIKGYLRMGGFVGEGAFVDHAFNTTDICLVLDTARIDARQRALYSKPRG